MTDGKLRVVADEAGRRWVQAADVPEVRRLGRKALRQLCPEVEHFEAGGRPVRWLPVDGSLLLVLSLRSVHADEAAARVASYTAAPLSATGVRRHGLPKLPARAATEGEAPIDAPVAEADPVVEVVAAEEPPTEAMALVPVIFDGDQHLVVTAPSGEHYAALSALCAPFGVDVQGQWRKLGALPWARVAKITIRDSRGILQPTCCVHLRSVAGWLFTLNAGKVAESVRPKLAKYQRDCAEHIADKMLGLRGTGVPVPDPRLDRLFAAVEAQSQATATLLGIVGTLVKRLDVAPGTPPARAPAAIPQPAPVAVVTPPPPIAPQPPPPTMLIPRDWRSSDVIAALLTERRGHRVPRAKVDGAIAAMKLRERPGVARHGMAPRTDGGGVHYTVPFWRYAPGVIDEVERHLVAKPAAQQTIPLDER